MTRGDEPTHDPVAGAAELLRSLLDVLPPAGARDVALRSKVKQRAAALDDVVDFGATPLDQPS